MKKFFLILVGVLAVIAINSCKKDMFQGVTEPDIIHNGKLFIGSSPSSMKIYLDGNFLGVVSPDTVNLLPDGNHKITLKHDLYPDTVFNVNLVNGETKSMFINGLANPRFYNKISMVSTPTKSKITFNDSATGNVTPYLWNRLLPGNYKIKLEYPQHRPDSIEVFVKKGVYQVLEINLEDTSKFVTYKTNNSGMISNNIMAIAIDNKNVKWIGAIDKGIMKFDGSRWEKVENPFGIELNQISKMLFDSKNRLWVNCASGLYMYENSFWTNYNDQVGTSIINDFLFDKDGNILICTEHGLYYQNGSSWKIINISNSCSVSDTINTAYFSKDGGLWIGTKNNSIFLKDGLCDILLSGELEDYSSIISTNVKYIFEDNIGRIWFFHKTIDVDHISMLVVSGMREYKAISVPYVSPNQLNSVYTESLDRIWFSCESGVVLRKADGSVSNVSMTNSSLPIKHCRQIIADSNGDYWVATMGYGIVKIKKGTIN